MCGTRYTLVAIVDRRSPVNNHPEIWGSEHGGEWSKIELALWHGEYLGSFEEQPVVIQ